MSSMLRKLLLFVALLAPFAELPEAVARPSLAEYRRLQLFELVCCADLVVAGKIVDVSAPEAEGSEAAKLPPKFVFEVEQTIAGKVPGKTIEVRCFRDWTCAARWARYEKGQRVVLFLSLPRQGSTLHSILGAGDDGEMPLLEGTVYPYGLGVRGPTPPAEELEAGRARAWKVPLAEFSAAVRGFRETFAWEVDAKSGLPVNVRPREDIGKARAFRTSSAMARKLFARVISSSVWTGPTDPLPTLQLPAGVRTREESGFGSEVCVLGDVDGDGIADLAAGDPYDDTIVNQHGALRILFLNPDGSVKSKRALDESKDSFPARMNEFAHLGEAVAPVGDIDGDGVPDLVVSAPGCGGSWEGRGSVWILCLTKDGSAKKAIALDGDEKLRDLGVTIGSGLGASIAALGDLDGDGFPELAIGQDPESRIAEKEGRSVFIVSLGGGGVVRWARRIHDHTDGFSEGYSWFGDSLAGVGDIDADGVPDLALSNSYDSDGGTLRGAVWIVCLQKDGTIKKKRKISDESGDFDDRLHDESKLGHDLYALGDIDGDGIPDLAASSKEGLWFLSLGRDGAVKASRILAADWQRSAHPQRCLLSLVRVPAPAVTKEARFILDGWVCEKPEAKAQVLQWFLRFDSKGELQSW
jgi:hypothetical protein